MARPAALFRYVLAVATALAVASASAVTVHPQAPVISSLNAETVPDSYIVVFKEDRPIDVLQEHFAWLTDFIELSNLQGAGQREEELNSLKHVYNMDSLRGYAGRFQPEVLDKIRGSEDVAFVEHDSMMHASDTERNAPWGLARISHREPLTFRTYNKYLYEAEGGEGVTVYVVDTGVNVEHHDFEGRATWGATMPTNDEDVDGNGHGTHVAGTIAGKRYGVAKKAKVVAVKVLRSNGSGTNSDVIKGVEWTVEAHKKEQEEARAAGRKIAKFSIANMSLGGGKSNVLELAVSAAFNNGVLYAVAAGNENQNACNSSPAGAKDALTVGASTIEDERAWFSNYGKCVDVFAPGKDITSTWIGSKVATNTISGTSMASPHVAGLAAYLLSLKSEEIELTTQTLKDEIIQGCIKDMLEKIPDDTPNLLIYNYPPSA